jgi:hypothetical protein
MTVLDVFLFVQYIVLISFIKYFIRLREESIINYQLVSFVNVCEE